MPKRVDPNSIIGGFHAVEALLSRTPKRVNHIVLQLESHNPKLYGLQKQAQNLNIRVQQVQKAKLDALFPGAHQGVLAFCNDRELDDWAKVKAGLLKAVKEGRPASVVVPAAMEDPRNFGACIRSSAALGVDALLYHNKGTCGLTPLAAKAAAGAAEQIALCQVNDIETELKNLSKDGFTILGLDAKGPVLASDQNLKGPMVFVIGGEDRGIPPHIGRACQGFLRLPQREGVHSYNASVALSLLLYEAARQNGFSKLTPEPSSP